MANPADIIKEYLVRLGFTLDSPAQAKIKQALGDLEKSLTNFSKNKGMAVLARGVTVYAGALASVAVATTGLMKKVADADLEYSKIAMRMHMTKDAAKQLTMAQKALGASIEDIVWNPELRQRYHQLRQQIAASATPGDAAKGLKLIRDVSFEFTKLKTVASSGMEWIVYHLGKFLGKDMEKLKTWLANLNKWLIQNIPKWTQIVARFLTQVMQLIKAVTWAVEGIWKAIRWVIDILPEGSRAFLAFFAIITAAFLANPVMAGLMTLLLLLDDFYVWTVTKGKGSSKNLAPIWEALSGGWDGIKASFEKIKKDLKEFFKIFENNDLNNILSNLNLLQMIFEGIAVAVANSTDGIAFLIKQLSNLARFMTSLPGSRQQAEVVMDVLKDAAAFAKKQAENTAPLMTMVMRGVVKSILPKEQHEALDKAFDQSISNQRKLRNANPRGATRDYSENAPIDIMATINSLLETKDMESIDNFMNAQAKGQEWNMSMANGQVASLNVGQVNFNVDGKTLNNPIEAVTGAIEKTYNGSQQNYVLAIERAGQQ